MARPENIADSKQITITYPNLHHEILEKLVKQWLIGSARNVPEAVAYFLSEICNRGEAWLPILVQQLIQREMEQRAAKALEK